MWLLNSGPILPGAGREERFLGLGGTFLVGTCLVSSVFGRDDLVFVGNRLAAVPGLGGSGLEAFVAVVRVVVETNGFLAAALVVALASRMQKMPVSDDHQKH